MTCVAACDGVTRLVREDGERRVAVRLHGKQGAELDLQRLVRVAC